MSLDVSHFIDLVQNFRQLWDKRDSQFKDKIANENAWESLATVMCLKVSQCRTLWASIRARYIRERKIYKTLPTGTGAYKCKWPHYEQCGFLDSAISCRRTKSNVLLKNLAKPSEVWKSMVIDTNGNVTEQEGNFGDAENFTVEYYYSEDEHNEQSDESFEVPTAKVESVASPSVATPKALPDMPGPSVPNIELETPSVINKLRADRNTVKSQTKRRDVNQLIATCSTIGDNLNSFLKNSSTPNKTHSEDYYFALSLVESFEKIKNKKRKLLLKAKVLQLVASGGDSDSE